MLKLFAIHTIPSGALNTPFIGAYLLFVVYGYIRIRRWRILLSGSLLSLYRSVYANARFTFNASTTTAAKHDVRGFMGTLSAVVGWMAGTNVPSPPPYSFVTFQLSA